MEEKMNACRLLVGKPEGKETIRRTKTEMGGIILGYVSLLPSVCHFS
jgi:hypothetical protein